MPYQLRLGAPLRRIVLGQAEMRARVTEFLRNAEMGLIRSVVRTGKYIWLHPANRSRKGDAVLRALLWQVSKRLTGRHLDLPVFGGLILRCYPNSTSASAMIYSGGMADYDEMNFIRRYLRPGDGFIDIGANIGVYTLLAASIVGERGRVESFEPGIQAVERLRENVQMNRLSQVTIHPVAVGERTEIVRFQSGRDTTNRMAGASGEVPGESKEVQCIDLDSRFQNVAFAMGKIDIEGAEPAALRGASSMLERFNPPVWLLEINGLLRTYGITEDQFAAWLAERRYRLAFFDTATVTLIPCSQPWKTNANVLAVAESKWDDVVKRITQARLDA
jgi:FkbM family methyltransferase